MSRDNTQHAVLPQLRFPEFKDTPAWIQKNLDEFGPFIRGLTYSASNVADEGLLVIRSSNIQTGKLVLDSDLVFVDKDCSPDLLLRKGDIAICMSNGSKPLVGKSAEFTGNFDEPLTIGAFCSAFRPSNEFAKYLLQTQRYRRFVADIIGGGNINNLKNSDLETLSFWVPRENSEQEKIADCLGSLDNLIVAEGQKLEALRDHKKGLMQQLFPREGETQPRLRFPEFRDMPRWIEESTKYVCERIMDGTHFSPQSTDGPRPYITSKNIRDGFLDLSTVTFISEEDHCEIYARCPVQKNDVLLTKDGASTGNCAINNLDYEFSLLSSVAVLRGKELKISPAFLYFTLASPRYKKQLLDSISGQAITRITLTKIKEYTVVLPSLDEQNRIADCLTALDEQIAAQAEKLDALDSHKRGLMQQLFPAAGDLAGGEV